VHTNHPNDPSTTVRDNTDLHRFELAIDGHTAFLTYERGPKQMTLVHTEVPPALQGRGLANVLSKAALDRARAEGLGVVAICPVVRRYMQKHSSDV
jgi:predicted GNAT family acetyltransferase